MSIPQFSIVEISPRYCRFTDGIIGTNRRIVATSYTKEYAIHICKKKSEYNHANGIDENFLEVVKKDGTKVYPEQIYIPLEHITDLNDDIPF